METDNDEQAKENPWYGPDPGHDPGATTAQWQSGHEDAGDVAAPIDTRDTYGNAGPGLARSDIDADIEIDEPPAGPYGLPSVIERTHRAEPPGTMPRQPTRDPSLSRAVDRAAAGIGVEEAGYDRAAEGPAPGPLEPDAEQEPPLSKDLPGGQWGQAVEAVAVKRLRQWRSSG
ncbi:MAG: hypothetical protein M3N29_07070 [Chloroflexota bacterium]|nr:hypothetical protein [Chloroflexota bacterium]